MFLQTQHFQQQDQYRDAQFRHAAHALHPFPWGVIDLEIDPTGLQNFVFDLRRVEILTWEGTVLQYRADQDSTNTSLEPRSFEQQLDPGGRALSVFVGVRRLQTTESNLADPSGGPSTNLSGGIGKRSRFQLQSESIRDLTAEDEQKASLQYLRYEAQILFDAPSSRSQDYELVKIAEVVRAADGKGGRLSQTYAPPCVTMRGGSLLHDIVKEIRDRLTAKGRELGEYRRRRGGETVELGSRDIGFLLLRQTVNRYIPMLHHVLEIEQAPPHAVYALLRQIVGELSTFSEQVSVTGALREEAPLPPYRHDALWPAFDRAAARIGFLLDEITTGPVGDVLLAYDGEYFSASLEESFFVGDNRYFLAIRSDRSTAELYRELQATGKITARDEIAKLQRSALFGLKIEGLDAPPEELLMRAHYRYFAIDLKGDHWAKIRVQRTLAVFCSSLPPETEIRLVAIFGR